MICEKNMDKNVVRQYVVKIVMLLWILYFERIKTHVSEIVSPFLFQHNNIFAIFRQ